MISVVIPLYNKESLIAETVRSVLNQTSDNFELVIVDDGSTDNSAGVVNTIADKRIKLISIENSGVSVARNTGIEAANYKWVALLDADDRWAPSFLDEMATAINNHPDHKVFASGRSRVFNDFIERYHHEFLSADNQTGELNYFKVISKYLPVINSSNAVIKKELFETVGRFRPGQRKHEDHDLWLRLCVNERVIFVNKELSFYLKAQNDSASTLHYAPEDFSTYLNTLLEVKAAITCQERIWFRRYCNTFVLISFIKNYKRYSRQEEREVFRLAQQLVTGKSLFLLKFLKALPFKNTYTILKLFKR